MSSRSPGPLRTSGWLAAALAGLPLTSAPSADARATRIVIDTKVSPAFNGDVYGAVGRYEELAGRAFGELDPNDPHDAIIQDIELNQAANSNVLR